MNSKHTLQICDIHKAFGKKKVLNGVTFELTSSECVGIIGMNGSGKTTLFNIIAGESHAQKGNINCDSVISYIPQENPLIEDLSTYDNLKLWYCDSPLNLKHELENGVLKELGINDFIKTKVKHLSGGMKKRLSIGCALANTPNFLILDEPSAALDLIAKDIIKNYLFSYKKQGGGIIIATHDESELALCDKVFVLKSGILSEISPDLRGLELVNSLY